jgi:negative regulator of sigma E activity
MKLYTSTLVAAAVSIAASTALFAQTSPSTPDTQSAPATQPAAPDTYSMPSSSQPANTQAAPGGSSKSKAAQLQNCISQTRAQNTGQSDQAIKQACKARIDTDSGTPQQ